jgi:hypothetical protein
MPLKIIVLLLSCAMLFPLYGRIAVGEKVQLDHRRITFLQGGIKKTSEESASTQVIVVIKTRDASTRPVLNILQECSRMYPEWDLCVLTPDPEKDASALLASRQIPAEISFGYDAGRKQVSKLMDGKAMMPHTFVISAGDELLWSGETADLPEFLELYRQGKYDRKTTRKVIDKLDELFLMLRESRLTGMDNLLNEVLTLDPGNASALRLKLFTVRATGDNASYWQMLMRELKKVPSSGRLYLSAVEFIALDPAYLDQLPALLDDFDRSNAASHQHLMMSYMLLKYFEFNSTALRGAGKILKSLAPAALPAELCRQKELEALYHYKMCDLPEAVNCQSQAAGLARQLKGEKSPEYAAMQSRLEFYRNLASNNSN